MKKLKTTFAVAILVFAGAAGAGDGHKKSRSHGHKSHDYALQAEYFDYARVIESRPIYREVKVSHPVRECWEAPVYHTDHGGHKSASGMLAGGLIGGEQTAGQQDEQAARVKRLLMYPAFVGVVVLLVISALMTFLVPELVKLIKNMGGELPFHTQALIAVSNFFVDWWYLILISPVLLLIAVAVLTNVSPGFRYAMDSAKLKVWVIGPILRKIILSRFATFFALMYSSGITVLECLRISETLVGNAVVADATSRAARQIADGASISAGFETSSSSNQSSS